ncbi:MAG: hypothetical protein Q8P56_04020, partial [Candidatus Uhrbacteria bacterium]|nr:hypothetical protein [Candidatus Uhrbacteria bacterium]
VSLQRALDAGVDTNTIQNFDARLDALKKKAPRNSINEALRKAEMFNTSGDVGAAKIWCAETHKSIALYQNKLSQEEIDQYTNRLSVMSHLWN